MNLKNQIYYLEKKDPKGIRLFINKLNTIQAGIFDSLTNLHWLSIDNNHLQKLRANSFSDLTNLARTQSTTKHRDRCI